MTNIGLLSDTHNSLPKQVYTFFKDCDIVLCAGDIGSTDVLDELRNFKETIAVYGNIDGYDITCQLKRIETFFIEKTKITLTHIGGYPNHYEKGIKEILIKEKPNIFISGHSHILKVIYDKELDLLHLNPGACGNYGFHKQRTLIRFSIDEKTPKNLEILEF
ncbi:MAG: metallophosphatase family protein [Bacteroidales bacterium]|jgi:putative phosphoesterase|nr:metallophosphatase family protein [Bacteroidales bacterium]